MGIKEFLESARRIFIISKKPTGDEYGQMAKVTAIGIMVLAVIGFVVLLLMNFLGLNR